MLKLIVLVLGPHNRDEPLAGLNARPSLDTLTVPSTMWYRLCHRYHHHLNRYLLQGWLPFLSPLRPLNDALQRYVLAAEKIHTDDTPVPALQPGRKQTKQGRLWGCLRDDHNAGIEFYQDIHA